MGREPKLDRMSNTYSILYGLVSFAVALLLGTVVLRLLRTEGWRNPLARAFALGAAAIVVWNLEYTIMAFLTDPALAARVYRWLACGWVLMPSATWYFSLHFRAYWSGRSLAWWKPALLVPPSAWLLWEAWHDRVLAAGFTPAPAGWTESLSLVWPGGVVYLAMVGGMMGYTVLVMLRLWRRVALRKFRLQIKALLVPALVTCAISLAVNIALPLAGVGLLPPLAHLVAGFWFVGAAHAVKHYAILGITPQFAAQAVMEGMSDLLFLTDLKGTIVHLSPSALATLGLGQDQAAGQALQALTGFTPAPAGPAADDSGNLAASELALALGSGETVPYECRSRLLRDHFGDPVGYMVLLRDLRNLKLLEKVASTDYLTGLGNRKMLDSFLGQEMDRYQRYQRGFALIIMDLDHFKQINDTHGHLAGDRVLARAGQVISQAIRSADLAGRWGGDEFLVICPETGLTEAREVAGRIARALCASQEAEGIRLTVSQGLACSQPGDTRDVLLGRADRALYRAKAEGRDRLVVG